MIKGHKNQSRTRQKHAASPRGLFRDKPQKIIVIVGPTASGKSDLAVKISRKVDGFTPTLMHECGGEIISVDSRQVYRGMDTGTGKITKKEMRGVPHHLLDVASPKSEFNVSHFKKLATKKIEEIVKRGHAPIIVGGTGFWIDALIYDWPIPEVKANRALRARLEKWPAAHLFKKLEKLDPARAASIKARDEVNNKRRLIRALEIVLESGDPSPKLLLPIYHDRNNKEVMIGDKKYQILILGVKLPQKIHEKRIEDWLAIRLKNNALLKEVKKLRRKEVSWKRLESFGLVYREVSWYLQGKLTYNQMKEEVLKNLKNYAKRQLRWFRRNHAIKWIAPPNTNLQMYANATNRTLYRNALKLVKNFLYR